MQADLFGAPEVQPRKVARPVEPFSRPDDRARAWDAWVEAGKPFPPPAGLVSACLSACMRGARR